MSRPGGGDEPVAAGQVHMVAGLPPAAIFGKDPVHGRALLRTVLDGDKPARPEQTARRGLD